MGYRRDTRKWYTYPTMRITLLSVYIIYTLIHYNIVRLRVQTLGSHADVEIDPLKNLRRGHHLARPRSLPLVRPSNCI